MTSGLATSDRSRRSNSREEKLLKVSDFLNQFQAHFLPHTDKEDAVSETDTDNASCNTGGYVGKITAEDLADALEFRSLLEKLENLQEQKFVVEEFGKKNTKAEPVTQKIVDLKTREIQNVQNEIAKIPNRTKLVFSMLRRCEVWTSKLVAQDHLVTSTELLPPAIRSKTIQSHFCPFINVPPSSYFERILPPIVVDNNGLPLASTTPGEELENGPSSAKSPGSAFHRKNICARGATLGLPPNKHTWRAYARLAIMASLIRDNEISSDGRRERTPSKNRKDSLLRQCLKSPTCVHDLNKRKGKNASHNHLYTFSPKSDLAPLWMRAQRNTRALRQLILLFEVRRETQQRENEEIEQMERSSKGNTQQFKATFQGNPFYVQERVIELSEDVDKLVEWAVINQSIFTYRYIKKEILTTPLREQQKAGRKRQRVSDDCQLTLSKKIFRDVKEKESLLELHQVCQSYLLRWFARRNREAVTILFSKRIEYLSLDIGCSVDMKALHEAKALRQSEFPSKVLHHMEHLSVGEFYKEDRTFSRIDRRLFIEDRYSGTSTITCQSQVSNLLKCLSKACPETSTTRLKTIDAAIDDWEHLCKTFYPATIDGHNQEDVHEAALKLVNPSQGCTESSIIGLLKSAPAPWVEKCCKCKKSGSDDLRVCFNCEKALHEKCSSGCKTSHLKNMVLAFPPLHDLFKLKQPTNLDRPDFSKIDNLWAKHTVRIQRERTENGGVRKLGLSCVHTEDCLKQLEATESDVFSFLELGEQPARGIGRKKVILPAKFSHPGCIINGVHKDLCGGEAGLQIGDIIIGLEVVKYAHIKDEEKSSGSRMMNFSDLSYEDRIAYMKVPSLELKLVVLRPSVNVVDIATTWYNGVEHINRCLLDVLRGMTTFQQWYCGDCVRSATSEDPKSEFLKASYCRALVRRIGMESYSEPFREEGEEARRSGFFSLRRLDSIMTHIMGVESNNAHYSLAPEAFNSNSQRLAWATSALERRPMDLLCKAMKTLIDSELPVGIHLQSQRSALLRHFLLTFTSWCVASTVDSALYCPLIGPPKIFQYSCAPWLTRRNITQNNQLDFSDGLRNFEKGDTKNRKEAEKIETSLMDYSKNASLVGKTFLVLPDDPLVEYVSTIVLIEHEGRPIEFLVASYLPSKYHDEVKNGRQKNQYDQFDENDGIYHLLPVVSSRQQNFLLDRCKMRNKGVGNIYGSSWTSLDVLNLDGVARYSAAALSKKMNESSKIRLAIEHAIFGELNTRSSALPSSFEQQLHRSNTEATGYSTSSPDTALEIQDKILDTLLEGEVGLATLREMLDGDKNRCPSGTATDDEESRNGKIVQRGENQGSLDFSSSYLKTGLLPINPLNASWKILVPEHISEKEYSLYYSDFLFQDEASKQDLNTKLKPSHILPYRGSQKKSLRIFTLSSNERNCSVGWGFEILRWANEDCLRVGRIKDGSQAYIAGLRTHDIIEAINGVRFSRFRNISSMICTILGASNLSVRMPANLDRVDEIAVVLSTIKSAKISLSSITLYVFRPSSISGQIGRPGTSSSHSTHAAQHSSRAGQELHAPGGSNESNEGFQPSRSKPAQRRDKHSHQRATSTQRQIIESNLGGGRREPAPSDQGEKRSEPAPNDQSQQPELNRESHQNNPHISRLMRRLEVAFNHRKPVAPHDFYRPAKNGTVLTVVEVAIFLEALVNRHWRLGVRLLMPRYEIGTLREQIIRIFTWNTGIFTDIPLVNGRIYQHVLNLDYERMRCRDYPESGPIILREIKDGRVFQYRAPIRALPMDRSIEKFIDAEKLRQQQQVRQQQLHQQQLQQQQQWGPVPQQFSGAHPGHVNQQGPNARQYFPQHVHHVHNNHQHVVHQYQGSNQIAQSNFGGQIPQRATGSTNNDDGASHTINSGFRIEPHQHQQNLPSPNNSNVVDLVDLIDEEPGGDEVEPPRHNDALPGGDEVEPPLHNDEPSLLVMLDSVLGSEAERIRGGGSSMEESDDLAPDTQSNYSYLCDIPKDKWNGIAVYTFVQTASKGSVCDDALLVGFARRCVEAHPSNKDIPDKVEIDTYYLSGTGYFEKIKMHRTDSDDVWIVNIEEDSEETRVIAKLRSQDRLPRGYKEEVQKMVLRNAISGNDKGKDQQEATVSGEQHEEQVGDQPPTATALTTNDQGATRMVSPMSEISLADALRLPKEDQLQKIYTCEEKLLNIKPTIENDSCSHECSLCSLPFEKYIVCTGPHEHKKDTSEQTFFRGLGHNLMSDIILIEQPSSFDGSLPGRLGEAKAMLLKIAGLVPLSMKIPANDVQQRWGGPLQSFRIFDNDDNYVMWQEFVTECVCTDMLAQGLVALLASIQRSKLPNWWSRKDCGWSTPYALLAGSDLSALYLHIYVLDAALSDVLSRSLKDKSSSGKKSAETNALQKLRMNNYWERAMALGYKRFEGDHNDACYICYGGGQLLCCDLCANVQHHECCNPPLTQDANLDNWLCDSCINDIDSFEDDAEYKDDDEGDDEDDEDFSPSA